MEIEVLLAQLSSLFLVMLLGIVIGKTGMVSKKFSRELSKLLLNIVIPCLIVGSATLQADNSDISTLTQTFLAATLLYMTLIICGLVFGRVLGSDKSEQKVYMYITIFSNSTNIGFPIIASVLGEGAIFYASIFNIYFNVLNYSLGAYLMDQKNEDKRSFKSIINPGLVASMIAIIIFTTGIKIPEILQTTLNSVGSINSPLSMILTGLNISQIKFRGMFENKKIYIYALLRQILMPLVAFPILRIFISSIFVQNILLIMITMPVGMAVILFANEYRTQIQLSTSAVFITTLFSYITIPLIIYIFT